MILRSLGKTSIKVSQISLGLSQFNETRNKEGYGYKSETEVLNTITYAIKKKINFFDTSDMYGDTEKILGKLSPQYKNRILYSLKTSRE